MVPLAVAGVLSERDPGPLATQPKQRRRGRDQAQLTKHGLAPKIGRTCTRFSTTPCQHEMRHGPRFASGLDGTCGAAPSPQLPSTFI